MFDNHAFEGILNIGEPQSDLNDLNLKHQSNERRIPKPIPDMAMKSFSLVDWVPPSDNSIVD